MISVIFETAFQQGFLYVIAVFGIVISFRMMNFPDLTVDGSFTLGGAVTAILLVNNFSIPTAILITMFAGFIAGVITAIINRKLGISKILSGILIMLMLYSINLRIMGKANISLLRIDTLFTSFESSSSTLIIALFVIAFLVFIALCYLAITRLGLFIRATGDNEFMVQSQGVNTDWIYIIGLGLANSLVALSGGLIAQNQGFADINMGIGLIITVLAALIIGESVISVFQSLNRKLNSNSKKNNEKSNQSGLPWNIFYELLAAMIGSIIYFMIIAICLQLGLATTDLKLATGLLVIFGIAMRFQKSTSETHLKSKI